MKFVNAQEMHKTYPATFEVPAAEELQAIQKGDLVKVSTGSERFWVKVTQKEGAAITGIVDNNLVNTEEHGLKLGDTIEFLEENVYSIWVDVI